MWSGQGPLDNFTLSEIQLWQLFHYQLHLSKVSVAGADSCPPETNDALVLLFSATLFFKAKCEVLCQQARWPLLPPTPVLNPTKSGLTARNPEHATPLLVPSHRTIHRMRVQAFS